MTKYTVHVCREMRLLFPSIEAGSAQAAAHIASIRPTKEAKSVHDCEGDNLFAVVDRHDAEGFLESEEVIEFEAGRLQYAAPEMESILRHFVRLGYSGSPQFWEEFNALLEIARSALRSAMGRDSRPA